MNFDGTVRVAVERVGEQHRMKVSIEENVINEEDKDVTYELANARVEVKYHKDIIWQIEVQDAWGNVTFDLNVRTDDVDIIID